MGTMINQRDGLSENGFNGHTDGTDVGRRESGLSQRMKDAASETAGRAKEVVEHVKERANSELSTRADKSAGDLGAVAEALRKTSEGLSGNMVAPYVAKAADKLEDVSRVLRTTNLDDAVKGTESFARREPLLFLGGAFVAGFCLARFLKSTSAREEDSTSVSNGGGMDRWPDVAEGAGT